MSDCIPQLHVQEQLVAAEQRCPGLCWWAARAVVAQQRAISKPALSLLRAVVHLQAASDAVHSAATAVHNGQQGVHKLHAARHVEAALAWQLYGYPAESARQLAAAGDCLRLQVRLLAAGAHSCMSRQMPTA